MSDSNSAGNSSNNNNASNNGSSKGKLYLVPNTLDFGVDGKFLVASWNEQAFSDNSFVQSRLRVFNKGELVAGDLSSPTDFARLQDTNGDLSFAVRPCRHYGSNSAFYLVNSKPLVLPVSLTVSVPFSARPSSNNASWRCLPSSILNTSLARNA